MKWFICSHFGQKNFKGLFGWKKDPLFCARKISFYFIMQAKCLNGWLMFSLKGKQMLQCIHIFCSVKFNANTPKSHKKNFCTTFTNFLIPFEQFTATDSLPMCIHCIFISSDCISRFFFNWKLGWKKWSNFFLQILAISGEKKAHQENKQQIF